MKKTILIIDDASNIRRLLEYNLQDRYQVITASDGLSGLHAMKYKMRPDLIIADISMPNISGLRLLEILRSSETYKDIPLVFLTARTKSEDRIKGLKMGADDYITKPFNPQELTIRIERLLQAQRRVVS